MIEMQNYYMVGHVLNGAAGWITPRYV